MSRNTHPHIYHTINWYQNTKCLGCILSKVFIDTYSKRLLMYRWNNYNRIITRSNHCYQTQDPSFIFRFFYTFIPTIKPSWVLFEQNQMSYNYIYFLFMHFFSTSALCPTMGTNRSDLRKHLI